MTAQDDWDNIKLFLTIMNSENLETAAKNLAISQSTISRKIKAFEANLGQTLFDRTSEGLKANEHAKQLFCTASKINEHANHFFETARKGATDVSGIVRLSSMPQFVQTHIIPAMPKLLEHHPQLSLEFVDDIVTPNLARRDSHISVRMSRRDSSNLIVKKIASLSYGIYANDDLKIDHIADLKQLPWITYDESMAHAPDAQWLDQHVGPITPVLKAKHRSTLLAAANHGLGVCLSPHIFTEGYPNLRRIHTHVSNLPVAPLWISCDHQYRKRPKIDAVWNFIVELAKEFY